MDNVRRFLDTPQVGALSEMQYALRRQKLGFHQTSEPPASNEAQTANHSFLVPYDVYNAPTSVWEGSRA